MLRSRAARPVPNLSLRAYGSGLWPVENVHGDWLRRLPKESTTRDWTARRPLRRPRQKGQGVGRPPRKLTDRQRQKMVQDQKGTPLPELAISLEYQTDGTMEQRQQRKLRGGPRRLGIADGGQVDGVPPGTDATGSSGAGVPGEQELGLPEPGRPEQTGTLSTSPRRRPI